MVERKVAIVTDATADLPSNEVLRARYNVGEITQIPLWVTFGEDSYRAGIDIDNEKLKKLLDETGTIPTTAASTPAVFLEEYKKLTEDGLEVVSVHVGENLSATIKSARNAAEMLGSNRVTILDSGTVSMALGLQAIALEKMAAEGASRGEIVAMHEEIKRRTKLRAVTPNMPFLRQSGRASAVEGIFGVLLNIKPILQIDNSRVDKVETPRTMGKALDWLVDFVREQGALKQVAIVDFMAEKDADTLKSRLINEEGIAEEKIYRGQLGQLTGTHGGPGTFGLITMKK